MKCLVFSPSQGKILTRDLKPPPILPHVRFVPGGMFLRGEATSLSYLPVVSVGRQGTTPSLAPEPQASPGHQTAAPHQMCSLRGWLFKACHSLLEPECVRKEKKKKQSGAKGYLQNTSLWVVWLVLPAAHEPQQADATFAQSPERTQQNVIF